MNSLDQIVYTLKGALTNNKDGVNILDFRKIFKPNNYKNEELYMWFSNNLRLLVVEGEVTRLEFTYSKEHSQITKMG